MTERGGRGSPLVLIPGIQGRWEWMAPAINALKRRHRVQSFSLGEVAGPGLFQQWIGMVDGLLDRAGESAAVVVGVSFGGLIALNYAAQRPGRVSHLVLVSAPFPSWELDTRSASFVQRPTLSLPLFAVRAVRRLGPEIVAALPTVASQVSFAAHHVARILRFPPSPRFMAACVREWEEADLVSACGRVTASTLVITGEPSLDRVVPVASSLRYLAAIPGARHAHFPRTGHLGLVLRPGEFAEIVTHFVEGEMPGDRRPIPDPNWRLPHRAPDHPGSSRST